MVTVGGTLAILLVAVGALLFVRWALTWARTRNMRFEPQFVVVPGAFARLAEDVLGEPPATSGLSGRAMEVSAAPERLIAPPPARDGSHPAPDESALRWAAAGVDAAMPGVEVWLRWSSVDDHVFQAVSHMTHEHIDGFADLLRVVDAKGYAIETAGFFNKLLGHLGEWHVQEHLMEAGHAVAMPFASNQPAVDLLVDGHGVNVKTVADAAAAAHAHFADHPDVPIVVPVDAANIPPDALYFDPVHGLDAAALAEADHAVIVDTALSHADMAEQAHGAIDVLQDPGPHAHVPWVTFAISAFREGRLLVKGSTDLARAAKNVAVDTAAVGGGGFVGMKAGAAFGALFGPVGSVVGGIAGGIVGAIGGRAVANAIKRAPLEEAKKAYDAAILRYQQAEQEAAQYAETTWTTARTDEQQRLQEDLHRIRALHDAEVQALRERLLRTTFLDRNEARRLLKDATERIHAVVEAELASLRQKTMGFRRLIAGIVAPQQYARVRALKRDARRWKHQADALIRSWPGDREGTGLVFDLVMATPDGQAVARAHLERVGAERSKAYRALRLGAERCLSQAARARAKAVARLRDVWSAIEAEVQRRLLPAKNALVSAADQYRAELRKAGVDV